MLNMSKLPVSIDLSKLISLPNSNRWRVAEFERVVDGAIPIRTRQMGWLFDSVHEWKLRPCSLTRDAVLLVYIREDKGFVLDMARALAIDLKTDAVHVHGKAYRRCKVKIRFSFGFVKVVLTAARIRQWRDALLLAADSSHHSPLPSRHSCFHDASPYPRVVAATVPQTEELPFAETPSDPAASPEWPTTEVCDDHSEISSLTNLLVVRQPPAADASEKNSALFTRSSSGSSFSAQLPVIEEEAPSPDDNDKENSDPSTLTEEKQNDALPLPAPKKKARYALQLDRTYSQRHSSLPVPLLCEQLGEPIRAIEAAKYKRRPRIVATPRPPQPPSFLPVYVATATKMISDYSEMPAISMIEDKDSWSSI